MPRKSISFDLDFVFKDIFPRFTVKQFDDVTFNIKPKLQGSDYDITGMTGKIFVGVNNDVFMQTQGITVTSNNIDIVLDKNMLQKNGRAYAEIELTDSNGTITSSSFIFNIDAKVGEGGQIPGGIEGFVQKYERLISEFKSQVNSSINSCNDNVANKLNSVDAFVNTKISDFENRFNTLTSSKQQDAEVIDARGGENSLKARLDNFDSQLEHIAKIATTEEELINIIENSKDGDIVLVGSGLIINNTIEINKRITLKGNIISKLNSSEIFNIKFNGVGELFKVGVNWNECVFKNLTLVGNKDNTQTAIKLSGNKSKIVDCNIINFSTGIEFYHYYDTTWTGENFVKNNFIENCNRGIYIGVDSQNGSTYDSYIENNIFIECKKWIYAEKLHNWRIDNNHFYSKTSQTESRMFIDSMGNTSITNNYIEVETECTNLIEINIKTPNGGNQIINNRIFSPQYELIESDKHVFKINILSWCESLLITGNTLATYVTQNNIYLCYLSNADNACYATVSNNMFPLRKIIKSERENWFKEVRLQQSNYNLRLSQGIVLNDYSDSARCLINSHSNFNDMLSETTKGLHITTDTGNIYYYDGTLFNEIVTNNNTLPIQSENGWISNGENKAIKHGRRVFVEFDLINGTNTENTLIFTIPSTHKPTKGKTVIANCYKDGDIIDKVELYVGSDGYVYLWKCNGAKRVLGEFSYFI